jgi:hypothetical protein
MLWSSWLFFCRVAVRSAAGLAVRLGRPPAVGRLGRSSERGDVRTRPDDVLRTWFSRKTSDVTTLMLRLSPRHPQPNTDQLVHLHTLEQFLVVMPPECLSWTSLVYKVKLGLSSNTTDYARRHLLCTPFWIHNPHLLTYWELQHMVKG